MKLLSAVAAVTGAGLAALPVVHAWGAVGHEIVATIAQIHLHPTAAAALCDLLPARANCHLAPVAAWADSIRNSRRWTGPLHYVNARGDHPSQTCVFKEGDWMGEENINVLAAVHNMTRILDEGVGDLQEQSEALWFLVHFMGDMHMPLHLSGRDKGGNGATVLFDGRRTNLHSVWDSRLISKSLRTIPRNYTRPLPSSRIENALRGTIYDPYIRRIMWEGVLGRYKDEIEAGDWTECPSTEASSESLDYQASSHQLSVSVNGKGVPTDDGVVCPFHWAEPIHELNCAIVWPKELDESPYSHSVRSRSTGEGEQEEHHGCSHHDTLDDVDLGLFFDLGAQPLDEGARDVDTPASASADVDGASRPRPPNRYLELDTPAYVGKIADQWIVERLLAQGGIRLAATLNYLYADPAVRNQEISWF